MADDLGAIDWRAEGERMRREAMVRAAELQRDGAAVEVSEEELARIHTTRFLLEAGFERRVTEPLPQWERVQASPPQLAVLRGYCDAIGANLRQGRGLILTGPPGVGKTQLLAIIAMYAMRVDARVIYAARGDVLLDWALDAKYRDQHDDYRAALRCDLLLLDDVDRLFDAARGDVEKGIPALDALADDRYRAMLATVLASNRPVSELAQVPGLSRSADRWAQCMQAVALSGESQRRAAQ